MERVLDVVRRIPPGKVMSYGDVAEFLGEGSARGVGRALAGSGDVAPWHRVVMADGSPAPQHRDLQLALLADDGTPLTPDGARVHMAYARWDGT